MHTITPASDWLEEMSARLKLRWPTIEQTRLEDLALDLWSDERWRSMKPCEAAREWLLPVTKVAEDSVDRELLPPSST